MRLTDTIAGEEVHFEPCGPGHVISIEVGNLRHYEFECTETDLRLIFERLGARLDELDAQQRFDPCDGGSQPSAADEALTYLRGFAATHRTCRSCDAPAYAGSDWCVPCRRGVAS